MADRGHRETIGKRKETEERGEGEERRQRDRRYGPGGRGRWEVGQREREKV